MTSDDNLVPFPGKNMTGRACRVDAFIHEDEQSYCLQFEMLNDFGVTLTLWKNGDEPCVGIWKGTGSCDFEQYARGLKRFKEFAEIATGNRGRETYGTAWRD